MDQRTSARDLHRLHDAALHLLHLLSLLLVHMVVSGEMENAVGDEEGILPLPAVPVFLRL